jgi:hypothetical protein
MLNELSYLIQEKANTGYRLDHKNTPTTQVTLSMTEHHIVSHSATDRIL